MEKFIFFRLMAWGILSLTVFLSVNMAKANTLFYSKFDDNLTASIAGGSPTATSSGTGTFINGLRQKSMVIGSGAYSYVQYATSGNINAARGTVSFWFSPVNYAAPASAPTGTYQLFLLTGGDAGRFGVQVQRWTDRFKVVGLATSFPGVTNKSIPYYDSINWTNGSWHHVALVWDLDFLTMYIDGKAIDTVFLELPFSQTSFNGKVIKIYNEAGAGQEQSSIDELKIFNRKLSQEEISELAESSSMLFHSGFNADTNLNADYAKGSATATPAGTTTLANTINKDGIVIGDQALSSVQYSAANNIDSTAGSMSLWVSPLDYVAKSSAPYGIYQLFALTGGSSTRFGVQVQRNTNLYRLLFYSLYFTSPTDKYIISNIDWVNNSWHHVVLTWDNTSVSMYIDGTLIGTQTLETAYNSFSDKTIKMCYEPGVPGKEKTALDEIKIFNRKLSADDVRSLFEYSQRNLYLTARYFPYTHNVWLDEMDFSGYEDNQSVSYGKLNVRKNNSLGDLLYSETVTLSGQTKNNFSSGDIGTVINTDGTYNLEFALYDSGNNLLTTKRNIIDWKSFPFTSTTAGNNTSILPPFTSIQYSNKLLTTLCAKYSFNDMGLYTQIEGRQVEPTIGNEWETMLYSPITIYYTSGSTYTLGHTQSLTVQSQSGTEVLVQGVGAVGNLGATLTNRIGYDGFSWIDLDLTATSQTINNLIMDIPIKLDQAKLFFEITDDRFKNMPIVIPTSNGTVWDSLDFPNQYGIIGNFKPMVWIGNEDRGLHWFAESDEGWSLDSSLPALELIKETNCVKLRVHFFNKSVTINGTRRISFGFMSTPHKTLPPGWRSWLPYASASLANIESFWYYASAPYGGGGDVYRAYTPYTPYPDNYAAAKTAMDYYRNYGYTFLLYQIMTCNDPVMMNIPEVKQYCGEWMKVDSANFCESFRDWKAWAYDKYLDQVGYFTIYDDEAFLRPMRDLGQGAGYINEDGRHQAEMAIRGIREGTRRTAMVWNENSMPNTYGLHKTTQTMTPAHSFAAITIDGELNFQLAPSPDYMDNFTLEYFKAHAMGRQFGFVPVWLSEIRFSSSASAKANRTELALLLLHDIIMWPGWNNDPNTSNMINSKKSDFNIGSSSVRFYPYWSTGNYLIATTTDNDIKVSLWKNSSTSKVMAVIVNLGEEVTDSVTFDFSKLNLTPMSAIDYETGNSISLSNGTISLTVLRHDFRLVLFQ